MARCQSLRYIVLFGVLGAWGMPLRAESGNDRAGAAAYYRGFSDHLVGLERDLPQIIQSAEFAADRYVKEDIQIGACGDASFCSEALGRAGGLMRMHASWITQDPRWPWIVLYALREEHLDEDAKTLQAFKAQGKTLIVFGQSASLNAVAKAGVQADFVVNNHAADGKRDVPTIPLANLTAQWVWTGEFIAALTRRGKMPPVYQSVSVAGAAERNQRENEERYSRQDVRPIAGGLLGRQYLAGLRTRAAALFGEELPRIRTVARSAAKARQEGHRLYVFLHGHALANLGSVRGGPGPFTILNKDWTHPDHDLPLKAGDFVLVVVYDTLPRGPEWGDLLDWVHERGATAAWSLTSYKAKDITAIGSRETYIDQHWELGDAIVPVEGYDVHVLPPSGVLGELVLFMVEAELEGMTWGK